MPLYRLDECPTFETETAVCLGMFDGVHLGHRKLIEETCKAGKEKQLLPCAFTFDVPPASVLRPNKTIRLLTGIEEKSRIMHALGLSHVVYTHFDESVSQLPAKVFFETFLVNKLRARHIVVGFHYRFGKNAEGDAGMLRELCALHGIALTVVPPVTTPEGDLISSTAIRSALNSGHRDLADGMLGPSPLVHPDKTS